jgi:hypothetical protein
MAEMQRWCRCAAEGQSADVQRCSGAEFEVLNKRRFRVQRRYRGGRRCRCRVGEELQESCWRVAGVKRCRCEGEVQVQILRF